ncbi:MULTISPECIES: ribokinase [unclassified Mesorhizobium]|uniref:ribokinase n=1 Tax=unclassified Mesorhizobium TaxID=325217 RepID=UPI0003CED783|nr:MULTISPECIES: ribokinase [unclassified Mesorhizobium]ESX18220.1 ribokinase [Mesorhizobium sp. LSJC255A00]ESX24219.1 ribokinase [Mesorhizobium sp. LSHC440B00]ESX31142.1 ribokinase [Mesorhizobium sp. LSHC432A00]ESX34567.1 ribokinase [Mesorhizobium sp. LSHC440A00]ESX68431.1 ribokinase [Mesorhizobium sp. LSHC414A00]
MTVPLVTVFGSLHYDIMVDAPDRPRKGETVTGRAWQPKCGGKGGNQAVSAARAGVRAAMIGAVGDDDFGTALLANLDRAGVDRRFVRVAAGAGSGMSVAIFDSDGDYGAVIVSGSNLTLDDDDVVAAREVVVQTAVLLLQNEVPDAANIAAARAVKASGGRVVLNAAPARTLSAELTALIDIVIVNAIEAEFLAGIPVVDTLAGATEAARRLIDAYPSAIVTAGGEGVAYCDRTGAAFALAAVPVKVVSTHGAGDEFVGAFAAGLARGHQMEAAIAAANATAALLVATPEGERSSR